MKVKISENNTKTAAMSGVSWEIKDTLGNFFEIHITYGNLERSVGIFPDEVNFTGKKLDPVTGLYYFNQRYYDPELGRFLSNDPKHQSMNPYMYCSNSPLMYVDPDGEFFFAFFAAAFWGGATAAGINVAAQIGDNILHGRGLGAVNWQNAGNSFASGALSAGLSFGVGAIGDALNMGDNLAFKTVAHGMSGGIQSMASGGSFGSGFAGGAAGNIFGGMGGDNLVDRTFYSGLGSGTAAMMTGGSFGQGFMAGAYNQMFNWGMHEGLNVAGKVISKVRDIAMSAVSAVPDSAYDGASVAGTAMTLVPHPLVRVAGKSIAVSAATLGAIKTGDAVINGKGDAGSIFFSTLGFMPPNMAVFGLTRGSAALMYDLER